MTSSVAPVAPSQGGIDALSHGQAMNPQFEGVLRNVRSALTAAQAAIREHSQHDISDPEALREAAVAVSDLRALMGQWEDIPNGMLDALDGALHDTNAALTSWQRQIENPSSRPGLINEAAERLNRAGTTIDTLLTGDA